MLIALIVTCEIAFWVVLAAALVARYLLRWRRTGAVLLVCVPLVDLVLLVASVLDLRRGGTPSFQHGLAAAYLGFSVAFGRDMVRWADERFAHRFAGGPPPWRPPKYGRARRAYEWRSFGKGVLGWTVAAVLLAAGAFVVGDAERAAPLLAWIAQLAVPLGFWLVFGPVLETLFPSREKRPLAEEHRA